MRFARHEEFTAWLDRNGQDHIEACDPIRGRSEQANEIYNLKYRIEHIEERLKGIDDLLDALTEEHLKRLAGRSDPRT